MPTESNGWLRPWRPSLGLGELARFASTASLPNVGLEQHDQTDRLLEHGPRAVAADLFSQLVRRAWSYNLKPWHADSGQLIRDPTSISRGSGTCLDLALLYCAMAKEGNLRPYLAVARGIGRGAVDHAFVIVDTTTNALTTDPPRLWDELDGEVRLRRVVPGDERFWASALLSPAPFPVPDTWLPIDPTDTCRRRGNDADQSMADTRKLFSSNAYTRIDLIDVVGAHAAGYEELPANKDALRPVLYDVLPRLSQYVEVPSRRPLIEELGDARGTIVISGEPGTGKSATANVIAARAAGGNGWLLAADDEATLKLGLAEAAMGQLGLDPAGLEGKDIEPFAQAAAEMLRGSDARWVVILDNADRPPESFRSIPKPGENQLVIVTTTATESWEEWVGDRDTRTRFVHLPSLTDAEARSWLGEAADVEPLPRTPLLINLAVVLNRAGVQASGGSTQALVGAALAAVTPSSLAIALSLAWLPPVAVPTDLLGPEAEPAIEELIRLGLLTEAEASGVIMHRSIRAAVRAALADEQRDASVVSQLLAAPEASRVLESSATLSELAEMATLLSAADLPDEVRALAFYRLGTYQERKDTQASAEWFEECLRLIDISASQMTANRAAVICGSLQGVARAAFRRNSLDSMAAALDRLRPVEQLAAMFPADAAVQVAASRAEAMAGIIRGRLATPDRIKDPAARRAEKLAALELVEHSARRRAEIVDPSSPDIDRSRFNIPGNLIGLAKDSPSRVEALSHLHRARREYESLFVLRSNKYRTENLEEVITCLHGSATTRYLEAVLDDHMPPAARLDLLRRAHEDAERARVVRVGLSGRAAVSADSLKSSALVAKIQALVVAIGNALGMRPVDALLPTLLNQILHEDARVATALCSVPAPAESTCPPLKAKADAQRFVEYLLSREELWALVEAFGDGVSGFGQRRRDLAELVLDGSFGAAKDPREDVANAQAGRVLSRWVAAPDRSLVTIPKGLEGRAKWLSEFSSVRWDLRAGLERDYIPTRHEMFTDSVASLIYQLAAAWNMLDPAPASGVFDHVIVLGGLMRANVNRSAAAASLIADGHVESRSVLGLAGARDMSLAERELAEHLACRASTEEGSLRWGLDRAFADGRGTWEPSGVGNMSVLSSSGPTSVQLATAPKDAAGRPTTGTAFEWLISKDSALLTERSRVLSVTTAIYWIDGHIRLLKQMPDGAELVTTGASARPANPEDPLTQIFRSQHYLQEIKSALDALPGLLTWASVNS